MTNSGYSLAKLSHIKEKPAAGCWLGDPDVKINWPTSHNFSERAFNTYGSTPVLFLPATAELQSSIVGRNGMRGSRGRYQIRLTLGGGGVRYDYYNISQH